MLRRLLHRVPTGGRAWRRAAGVALVGLLVVGPSAGASQRAVLRIARHGDGRVVSADGRLSCGHRCAAAYPAGTIVQLRAQDTRDFAFSAWDGGCVGSLRSCFVQAGGVSAVRALFTRKTFELRLTVGGPGVVRSSPPGLVCGQGAGLHGCTASFGRDTAVTLHARPARLGVFGGWRGPCTSGRPDCAVQMSGNRSATAGFGQALPAATGAITVQVEQPFHRVASVPAGIDCRRGCSGRFETGTLVVLHASLPFTSWAGACRGFVPSCPLLAGSAFVVRVSIPQPPFTPPTTGLDAFGVNVQVSGRGVVVGGGQINCGRLTGTIRACAAYFAVGSVVELRALPAHGYRFTGWTGFCSGKGRCRLNVDATKVVYALFGR